MPGATEATQFERIENDAVRGYLHRPATASGAGLALTHGAGSDCNAPLLVAVADAFASAGLFVLRCDLAFRRQRAKGPPFPASAAADRESLRQAMKLLGESATGPLYLGGHSYGGRQASMLAAEAPGLAAGLLLLAYPLHPPAKPAEKRTAHFAKLQTPCVFVSGTNDAFGSPEELEAALRLIPAQTRLLSIEGAGHDLKRGRLDFAPIIAAMLG
jgi:predicted alpha/beta-hydrolase family hydrolase